MNAACSHSFTSIFGRRSILAKLKTLTNAVVVLMGSPKLAPANSRPTLSTKNPNFQGIVENRVLLHCVDSFFVRLLPHPAVAAAGSIAGYRAGSLLMNKPHRDQTPPKSP